MEEENVCSSTPDCAETVLPPPEQESGTSADQRSINGEKDAVVWGETEVQISLTDKPNDFSFSPMVDGKAEEGELCEETWSPHHITCSSPPISVATVQWDMPNSCTETPSLMTDSSLASELDFTSLISTSPSLLQHQAVDIELFEQGDEEEQDDTRFLDSTVACSGNDTQSMLNNHFQPCDAEDVNEPKTQEKDDSGDEQPDSNNAKTPLEEEGERSLTSAAVVTEDFTETAEDVRGSEEAVDGCVDTKQEEEQEISVLLSEQEDSEEEQSSANGAESKKENEDSSEVHEQQSVTQSFSEEEQTSVDDAETEEKSVIDVYSEEESEEVESVDFLRNGEVPVEAKSDNTGLNTSTDKLTDLHEPELLEDTQSGVEKNVEILEHLHEDLKVQPEELEMCEDVDQNVDSDQSEAVNDDEEAPVQEAENVTNEENLPETEEVTENLVEMNCLEHLEWDPTASQPESTEAEQQEVDEQSAKDSDPLGQSPGPPEMDLSTCTSENPEQPEGPDQPEQTVGAEAEIVQQEQTPQPTPSEETESEISEQPSPETEATQLTEEADLNQAGKRDKSDQAVEIGVADDGHVQKLVANGHKASDAAAHYMNGGEADREKARRLAERLFNLDDIDRADVVKHLDKDNDFSRTVGEEYLKFFDFTQQTLDQALRSFLKVVVLIGESQERERVLQHFSNRFHQCNPDSYSSSGAVLALTCAVMLLNTDLHGQLVGKAMSSAKFVSNLDGMNEGENFNKDLLKSLYNSIKSEPLEWAVDEEELKNLVDDNADNVSLRSSANPFQDVPHDEKAAVIKEGILQRKLHADINGKRTPWGKRGWKMFSGVLKGMVLYLQKVNYHRDLMISEEVVSVHHSLAERASDYTKKPHVFRLQTADWRVFLFQASSKMEMYSWINRINFVSALHSSPPFAAAVGSQRRFFRPILPCSQSAFSLECQLQFHRGMLESFTTDLSDLQQNVLDAKKAKAKDLEEHRVRTEYLQHEMCRYGTYIQMLETWKGMKKMDNGALSDANLTLFDKAICADAAWVEEEKEGGLKKSYSSPSLEMEVASSAVKVKRNISERRTYRRKIVPRWNTDCD